MARVLAQLGSRRAVVVSGADGLGEISLAAKTYVTELRGGELRELVWSPRDFGLHESPLDALMVSGPAESAARPRSRRYWRGSVDRPAISWC
jgi:anthranilate phosphoribosyltransferase